MPATAEPLAWYVGYGSNLAASRLGVYLAGGRADGAARVQPGCRDPRPPRADRPVELPGTVYFAWESPTWTGGIAFYDPDRPGAGPDGGGAAGPAQGRAYLLTRGQVLDLLTQEMHRVPGEHTDLDLDLDAVLAGTPQVLGDGRYERVQPLPALDGVPALTLTAPWGVDDIAPNPPVVGYLRLLARGLAEGRGWDVPTAAAYLASRPGAAGAWTAASLTAALTAALNAAPALPGPAGSGAG